MSAEAWLRYLYNISSLLKTYDGTPLGNCANNAEGCRRQFFGAPPTTKIDWHADAINVAAELYFEGYDS